MAKKRDNGTGTIYRRDNGTWVGKIYIGRDHTGKEKFKYLSGKTESDVKRKIREYNKSATPTDTSRVSVENYIYNWLNTYKKNTIKDTSYDTGSPYAFRQTAAADQCCRHTGKYTRTKSYPASPSASVRLHLPHRD